MRILKAVGVYILALLPFVFFDWGSWAWIPGLAALVVAVVYYRRANR
jgi:hypothetical protein